MGAMRFALLWLLPLPLAAQQPLRLHDVVELALRVQPALQQAEAQLARAEALQREQRATRYPALTTEAALTRFQEPMVVAPLHGFDPRQPPLFDRTLAQGNVTLGYTVWDGGARGARVDRASAQLEGAQAAHEAASALVILDAVRRYTALVTTRELLQVNAARMAALEAERTRAARLLEQGRVARVVLLRAEAALSGARAEHAAAQSQLELAEHDLARTTGLHVSAVRTRALERLSVQGEVPERDEAVRQALAANADVRRLRAQLAAVQASVTEATAQWWPRVQLGGRYVRYASGAGDAGGEWQSGVQLSYALFTAGARPAAQERARAETRAATAELALIELRVAEQVDRAQAALNAARARTEALAAAVEQSAEVARIERLALDTGAGVQTDYLAAEAELLRTRAALTEARFAEIVARVELARATGALTVVWLEQNVETGT